MNVTDDGYEHYSLKCSFEGNGEVSDADEKVLWNLTTARPTGLLRYGALSDPGCSFSNPGGSDSLRVTRKRQLLLSQFQITRDKELLCTITQTNLFHNKYKLEFAQDKVWAFYMPLFTVYFQGVTEAAHIVQVREWTKRQWLMRVKKEASEPFLPCALIIIQRERLRSG